MGSRPAATRRLRHRGTRRYGGAGDFGACTTIGRRIRRFAFRCSYRAAIRTSRRAAGTAVDALRPIRLHRAGTQSDTPQAQKSSCASPKTDRSAVDVRPACTVGAAARRSCFRTARSAGARELRPRKAVCKSELGGESADQRVLPDDDGAYSRTAGGTSAGAHRTSGAAADRTSTACHLAPHAGRYRAACF